MLKTLSIWPSIVYRIVMNGIISNMLHNVAAVVCTELSDLSQLNNHQTTHFFAPTVRSWVLVFTVVAKACPIPIFVLIG